MEDFLDDEAGRGGSLETILDEILPEELEWERLVRDYPVPAVAIAAVGGFWLGLRHGPAILSAVSTYLASEVSRNVSQAFDRA